MQPETVEAEFVLYISPFAESHNAPLYVPAVKEKKTKGLVTQAAKPHIGQYARYTLESERLDSVLGICPLMRLYSNVTGTIPEWAAGQQAKAFLYGRKSTAQVPGSP
eukprot:2533362-Rhodomonas_salina.4